MSPKIQNNDNVSDDSGAIWINVPEKVHTLSHHETDTKVLNSRLEKQAGTLKNGSEDDAMVHGVLGSLMKEVNQLMSRSSEPLPLGTVLKVRGWLLDSNGFRKVRAIQLSFIDDPHKEAEMMAYLASLYRQLYAPK
ncbi:uncharacterized protein LOC134535072 isoform X2 [Bacillus rossius redtenbacheri]|uniref:uncharacterized protein LOC134535072 isoform X2 n=1 Tax=Bacillus rossius redtenbacheri TaxID=93214 RepID=UPI002FDF0856